MAATSIWARLQRMRSTINGNNFWVPSARYLFICAAWVPAVITFNDHVGEVTFIHGASMYPFLNAEKEETTRRDMVWNHKFRAQRNLARGMVVTFWSPFHPESMAVKRIVGLEGDVIRTRAPYPVPSLMVPPNHVWVEGDGGPHATLDSNTYGPIPVALVQGRITWILRPLSRFGRVRWEERSADVGISPRHP